MHFVATYSIVHEIEIDLDYFSLLFHSSMSKISVSHTVGDMFLPYEECGKCLYIGDGEYILCKEEAYHPVQCNDSMQFSDNNGCLW